MKTIQTHRLSDRASYSCFSTEFGCEEFFLTLRTAANSTFAEALATLADDYRSSLQKAGLSEATAVFSRLFLSDAANQKEHLELSPLIQSLRKGALSIVEQKSVGAGQLSLFSYHLRSAQQPVTSWQSHNASDEYSNANSCKGKNYSLLLTANFSNDQSFDAYQQTKEIFSDLNATIEHSGMRLLDNTIRTWIFVRDIDNHYKNMVRSRKEFFTDQGLTNDTRYLASTGIEGGGLTPERLVNVDSLSIGGLQPSQIIRMEATTHLSPTIQYGVTFERGLRVRFGDRSHLYISGTASINNKGEVLFVGDVVQQTRRTIENIGALLAVHGAALKDLAYLIVYVRNFHEWALVQSVLREELGEALPIISVEAKVCRPAWLVEAEGVAVIPDKTEFPPFL